MRTRIFHQLLPVVILILAALVVAGVRRLFWHPNTKGWSSYYQGDISKIRRDQPEQPEPAGSVVGEVLDDNGQPIYAIQVDLMPVDKARAGDDERWNARLRDWTDREGTYRFSQLKPGEYLLSVGSESAPTGDRPFAAIYYPGTDREKFSEPIRVHDSMEVALHPLRLRRLPTAVVKVHVRWQDGTPVDWSNLLFHNTSFPYQGVIGDEAPGIKDGEGEFTLPIGFEYYARAAATCDAGAQVKSEESRPVQKIGLAEGNIPQELTFVIPASPCKHWSPDK
jgi:hypothetical protein